MRSFANAYLKYLWKECFRMVKVFKNLDTIYVAIVTNKQIDFQYLHWIHKGNLFQKKGTFKIVLKEIERLWKKNTGIAESAYLNKMLRYRRSFSVIPFIRLRSFDSLCFVMASSTFVFCNSASITSLRVCLLSPIFSLPSCLYSINMW